MNASKQHWEHVYETKAPNEVSWTQEKPTTSLDFIYSFHVAKDAPIIDIGGGDSKLVDYLLVAGYTNITVLDISEFALQKAKLRLGENANKVKWIVSDILDFKPTVKYDVWHDRAVFHFLTKKEDISTYLQIATDAIVGHLIMGTFSENGPLKCSGLEIKQYSATSLQDVFSGRFDNLRCIKEDHLTPFNTTQNFLYCSFKKVS